MKHDRQTVRLRLAIAMVLFGGFAMAGDAVAAALEHGHSRARTRWFVHRPASGSTSEKPESTVTAKQSHDGVAETASSEVDCIQRRRPFFAPGALFAPGSLFRREEDFRKGHAGYLADGPPTALRFSDLESVSQRPASPALPEFNFASRHHEPYLLESPLDMNPMSNPELLSQVVIELEPHRVLSGVIDTRRQVSEVKVEHFELEESRTTILRPEEVLIFFESDRSRDGSSTVIPFSPATPAQESTRSRARFRKE